jgi:LmbE family N-acetylglucosaminyl deacetylase
MPNGSCKPMLRKRNSKGLSMSLSQPDIKQQVLILSPHLDDAVLSCGSHIVGWLKENRRVTVMTVFSRFPSVQIPAYTKRYVRASGFTRIAAFAQARLREDRAALRELAVGWRHLDFPDAGFRSFRERPLYPTQRSLFSGTVVPEDAKLLGLLASAIRRLSPRSSTILTPLGIGRHVDHLMLRRAAQQAVPTPNLRYYLDYPYSHHLSSWSLDTLSQLSQFKFASVKFSSRKKRRALRQYRSQVRFFKRSFLYVECLFIGATSPADR